jgi:gas vesicle protein
MADFRLGNYEFSRHRNGYRTALGFLMLGLGIGTIGALLLTPKTGRQLRKEMRRRYEDTRDVVSDLGERAGDIWERSQEWAEAARRRAEPVARRFRRA